MLYDRVIELYDKSRLLHYRAIFGHIHEKEGSLSATEAFAADVVYLLGTPTIKQVSNCLGISQPNGTYKINNLIAKGYIEKLPAEGDKRESRVRVCNKYFAYNSGHYGHIQKAVDLLAETSTPQELEVFEKMLQRLGTVLEGRDGD